MLNAETDVLVNTVNTVGVMGKGIVLMFKEAYPENYKLYKDACRKNEVRVGKMFVTQLHDLLDSIKWIVNFPTKKHWKNKTEPEWVTMGLIDLRRFILENSIQSISIPPLGCGNGGLDWAFVKHEIVEALGDLRNVDVFVYEPTSVYQNVPKRSGASKLTPARAMIAEMVRQYWILGIECSLLEIQKLAWFLEFGIRERGSENPLNLCFSAGRYGPYTNRLQHLLNSLDGSFLHCSKRLSDARPSDTVWFDYGRKEQLQKFLNNDDFKPSRDALEFTREIIDGFESPLGLELLATVHWLIERENCDSSVEEIRNGLKNWPGEEWVSERKLRILDERLIGIALERLS